MIRYFLQLLAQRLIFLIAIVPFQLEAGGGPSEGASECLVSDLVRDARNLFETDVNIVLAKPINQLPASISEETIVELRRLEECTVQQTASRISADKEVVQNGCDVFKISVTLGGLRSTLEETQKCVESECDKGNLSVNRDVMLLQIDRLNNLMDKCD